MEDKKTQTPQTAADAVSAVMMMFNELSSQYGPKLAAYLAKDPAISAALTPALIGALVGAVGGLLNHSKKTSVAHAIELVEWTLTHLEDDLEKERTSTGENAVLTHTVEDLMVQEVDRMKELRDRLYAKFPAFAPKAKAAAEPTPEAAVPESPPAPLPTDESLQ